MTPKVSPREQQDLILEESEERLADRDASPATFLEHRTSDEATPPVDE
jgi:hypothetical protein